jgi:hypothetical protein
MRLCNIETEAVRGLRNRNTAIVKKLTQRGLDATGGLGHGDYPKKRGRNSQESKQAIQNDQKQDHKGEASNPKREFPKMGEEYVPAAKVLCASEAHV